MKHLLEIANIVTWKKVKKIEIFDETSLRNKNSKFNEFFEALMDGKFKNDRDAASSLYGCSPTDDKYRQLKSRFRKRILNTLFFIDVNLPSTSGYDRAYFSCNKDWTLVKILQSYGAHVSAEDLAKSILTVALKFSFADLIVNCSRILREYAAQDGDDKSFDLYNNYISIYNEILAAEMESENYYQQMLLKYKQTSATESTDLEPLDNWCNELIQLSERFESPVINFNMFLLWITKFELENDHNSVIAISEKAEEYIKTFPQYEKEEKILTFQLKKMLAYLHLKDFKNGKINAEKNMHYFVEGTDEWYEFMEYYFLLAMYTDNLVNTMGIYQRVTNLPKFKKASRLIKEKWKIYQYYMEYLIEIGGDKNLALTLQKSGIKLNKLLTDPVLYPKELRILTIHTVIAQVLFALERKNFVNAAENIERLKSYTLRQLKTEENQRMILFIKLLQQLMKADFTLFHLSSTEKYVEKLEEKPLMYRGNLNDLEIIPLENLWKILLERIK